MRAEHWDQSGLEEKAVWDLSVYKFLIKNEQRKQGVKKMELDSQRHPVTRQTAAYTS